MVWDGGESGEIGVRGVAEGETRGGGEGGVKRVVKGGRGGEEKLMSGRTQTMKNNFINNPEIQGRTRE